MTFQGRGALRSVLVERLYLFDDEVVDRRAVLYQLQAQLTAKNLQELRGPSASRRPEARGRSDCLVRHAVGY